MKSISGANARTNLYRLIDEVADTGEPLQITGRRSNAVLVSEEAWEGLQETLYRVSMPGMRESIIEGLRTPIEGMTDTVDW